MENPLFILKLHRTIWIRKPKNEIKKYRLRYIFFLLEFFEIWMFPNKGRQNIYTQIFILDFLFPFWNWWQVFCEILLIYLKQQELWNWNHVQIWVNWRFRQESFTLHRCDLGHVGIILNSWVTTPCFYGQKSI